MGNGEIFNIYDWNVSKKKRDETNEAETEFEDQMTEFYKMSSHEFRRL